MSEEAVQAANATEEASRHGDALGAGPAPDDSYTRVGRRRGRVTCVTFCLTPGQRRRGQRCPCCYGEVEIRPLEGSGVEPGPGRWERFAAWLGGLTAAFADALLFPFRVGRAHTQAMIRDILQEVLEAGLAAEVDGLADILTVLEALEKDLRGVRDAVDAAGE